MDNTAIVSVQEQKQLQLLNNGLITADRFINKNYLINISEQNIVPLDDYEKTTNSIRLFQIIKLVYDKTENINDKLISVYSALQNVDSSALLVINGNGREVTFYIGIRSVDNAATASKILEKSFVGNFPGSTLRSMKNGEIAEVMATVAKTDNYNTSRNVSCVTVIPSMRDAIKRTHSTTTIKSKMNEIARAEKEITVAEKKIADMERYNTREYIRESSPVTNLVFSMVCEKFDNKI